MTGPVRFQAGPPTTRSEPDRRLLQGFSVQRKNAEPDQIIRYSHEVPTYPAKCQALAVSTWWRFMDAKLAGEGAQSGTRCGRPAPKPNSADLMLQRENVSLILSRPDRTEPARTHISLRPSSRHRIICAIVFAYQIDADVLGYDNDREWVVPNTSNSDGPPRHITYHTAQTHLGNSMATIPACLNRKPEKYILRHQTFLLRTTPPTIIIFSACHLRGRRF